MAAADPLRVVPPHLPAPPAGRTFVAAVGKAAAAMALAVERAWPPEAPLDGIALTRYGHGLPLKRIRLVEAGHPLPDESGLEASRDILAGASALTERDLLLALISGGGSALLALPAPGVELGELRRVTGTLLRAGADIREINTVRKHLSGILGGRLAAACAAPCLALVISDVTGDDPAHVASGPCAPDPTTVEDARAVLAAYGVACNARLAETPKPDDPVFARTENRVIATARHALLAAADVFRDAAVLPVLLGDTVAGEAREVAKVYAALARQVRQHGEPWPPPVALLSGGECTVTVRSAEGRGGRCGEFLLSLAIELDALPGVWAIAADTDGVDGTEANAGAFLAPDSLARGWRRGRRADADLSRSDSYRYFATLGDLVITGPTRTNVNDYRAILIL